MFNIILKFPIFYIGLSKYFNYNKIKNLLNINIIINLNIKKLFIKDKYNMYSNIIIKEIIYNIKKTSAIKTKSYINKSNKKPWAQKGLGRARAGSFASPIWRGGGVLFGPIPGKINFKIQKKELLKLRFYLFYNKRSNIYIFKYYNKFLINKNFIFNEFYFLGLDMSEKILILEYSSNININIKTIIKYNYIIFLI